MYAHQSLRSKAREHILRTSAKDNDRNGFNLENFKNWFYSSFTMASEKFWYYFQRASILVQGVFTTKTISEGYGRQILVQLRKVQTYAMVCIFLGLWTVLICIKLPHADQRC